MVTLYKSIEQTPLYVHFRHPIYLLVLDDPHDTKDEYNSPIWNHLKSIFGWERILYKTPLAPCRLWSILKMRAILINYILFSGNSVPRHFLAMHDLLNQTISAWIKTHFVRKEAFLNKQSSSNIWYVVCTKGSGLKCWVQTKFPGRNLTFLSKPHYSFFKNLQVITRSC